MMRNLKNAVQAFADLLKFLNSYMHSFNRYGATVGMAELSPQQYSGYQKTRSIYSTIRATMVLSEECFLAFCP